MKIAYLHGFQSSSKARKATILKNELSSLYPDIEFVSLDFPDDIHKAVDVLSDFVKNELQKGTDLCLVGSSMGGFFSLVLQVKFDLKIALVNPCIYPLEFCIDHSLVNVQLENFDTHDKFVITQSDIEYLKELEEKIKEYKLKKTAVFLQTGDEVLDYTKAVAFFKDSYVNIENGGSHTYENFEKCIHAIVNFFRKESNRALN